MKDYREKEGTDRVHLVTHSFAGIDARAAISLYDAHFDIKSLTTIATPHTACRLIQNARSLPLESRFDLMERALGVVGMGVRNVQEFSQRNLDDFNMVAEDHPNVDYFSFGTKKRELLLNDLLRRGYEIIN